MVVNKVSSIFIVLFSLTCILNAEILIKDKIINEYVEKKLKLSLIEWGDAVKMCRKKEEQSIVSFDPESLKKLNVSVDEFRTATMALNYRNYAKCEKSKKDEYMYMSLLVYKIKQECGEESKDTLNLVLASMPSNEVLEALINYEKLLPRVKTYFEQHIGKEPFDIVKVSLPILEYFRK